MKYLLFVFIFISSFSYGQDFELIGTDSAGYYSLVVDDGFSVEDLDKKIDFLESRKANSNLNKTIERLNEELTALQTKFNDGSQAYLDTVLGYNIQLRKAKKNLGVYDRKIKKVKEKKDKKDKKGK